MSEFAPAGSKAKMTKSQVRRYIKEMERKRKKAQEELDKLNTTELKEKNQKKLAELEDKLDDIF